MMKTTGELTAEQRKPTVVVVVEKGMVMEVLASEPEARIIVIDLDTELLGRRNWLRAAVEGWRGVLHQMEVE